MNNTTNINATLVNGLNGTVPTNTNPVQPVDLSAASLRTSLLTDADLQMQINEFLRLQQFRGLVDVQNALNAQRSSLTRLLGGHPDTVPNLFGIRIPRVPGGAEEQEEPEIPQPPEEVPVPPQQAETRVHTDSPEGKDDSRRDDQPADGPDSTDELLTALFARTP